jgi:SPP1 family predicted phage head-tail adaptor
MTAIGKRRHRVTITRRKGNSLGTRGQLSQEYTTVEKNVLVSISQLSGDERVLANQVFPSATHSVNMRWREGLAVEDRLTFGSRRLNILDIDNVDERNREYVITAGEEL